MRPSGSVRRTLAAAAMLVGLSGCWLGLGYGFAGGGLPQDIRTVAVLPFDNQTPSPELQAEFAEAMQIAAQRGVFAFGQLAVGLVWAGGMVSVSALAESGMTTTVADPYGMLWKYQSRARLSALSCQL